METLEQAIKDFFKNEMIAEIPENFSKDDSFLESGIIDSTGVLELVLFLEEKYKIKISDNEIMPENLDSFNNIEKYIEGKMK